MIAWFNSEVIFVATCYLCRLSGKNKLWATLDLVNHFGGNFKELRAFLKTGADYVKLVANKVKTAITEAGLYACGAAQTASNVLQNSAKLQSPAVSTAPSTRTFLITCASYLKEMTVCLHTSGDMTIQNNLIRFNSYCEHPFSLA